MLIVTKDELDGTLNSLKFDGKIFIDKNITFR